MANFSQLPFRPHPRSARAAPAKPYSRTQGAKKPNAHRRGPPKPYTANAPAPPPRSKAALRREQEENERKFRAKVREELLAEGYKAPDPMEPPPVPPSASGIQELFKEELEEALAESKEVLRGLREEKREAKEQMKKLEERVEELAEQIKKKQEKHEEIIRKLKALN